MELAGKLLCDSRGLGESYSLNPKRMHGICTEVAFPSAKVIIGDLDIEGAEQVMTTIRKMGGQGAAQRCDVTNWDDQISLFELAESRYGSVDT